MLPSCIKSKRDIPRPIYFFATLTTNLRFASVKCFWALSPSIFILLKYLTQRKSNVLKLVIVLFLASLDFKFSGLLIDAINSFNSGGSSLVQSDSVSTLLLVISGSSSNLADNFSINSSIGLLSRASLITV